MPQRAATIEGLPMAFALVKEMQADGLEWGEGYRPLGRQALAEIIQGRMAEALLWSLVNCFHAQIARLVDRRADLGRNRRTRLQARTAGPRDPRALAGRHPGGEHWRQAGRGAAQ